MENIRRSNVHDLQLMKPIRCRDKQCRAVIAYINGPHKEIECPKCGKVNRVYTESKGIRFKMAAR
jgi:phage FluMu protein Com